MGYPRSLEAAARWAVGRTKRNQQAVINVHGLTGSGKTNAALYFGWLCMGEAFDPERHVVLTQAEYETARRTFPPGSVIISDEKVGTGGLRRAAQTKENRASIVDINRGRKLGHILIDIVPFADDYDRGLSKHAHAVWEIGRDPRTGQLGYGVWNEVQLIGRQKKKVWWETRFTFDHPHMETFHPGLWAAYDAKVYDVLHGRTTGKSLDSEERIEQAATILDAILARPAYSSPSSGTPR